MAYKSTITEHSFEGRFKIRKKLVDAGVLMHEGNNLIFTEDASFSSPSAASSIVPGRQAPGPMSWINTSGKTDKEVQESHSNE
ncbi:DUF4357 domain-containing protein [Thiomicrorhabdus sp.]|uniref:DUF4357 domain-containing protein n=1 Tax=Thiomicrorhabdus sp. TaxID=2039724 RepID=UPI0037494B81